MPRKIEAITGGKLSIKEDVEAIFERRVVPHGNGAKVVAQKKRHRKKSIYDNSQRLKIKL